MPTTETLIVIGGITIAGLAWLLMPFFVGRSPSQEKVEEKQLERLLMYYEQVMATLRDLEEDYLTGKLNQEGLRRRTRGVVCAGCEGAVCH